MDPENQYAKWRKDHMLPDFIYMKCLKQTKGWGWEEMGSNYAEFLFEVMKNLINVDCDSGYTALY